MTKCTRCQTEWTAPHTKCPACGSSLADDLAETKAQPVDYHNETPTRIEFQERNGEAPLKISNDGQLISGTVLGSRYRIIGLIGKGGMGEVYKAEDIKLAQVVALKFLPDSVQGDSAALERFHAEVRNARHVSHVNVCRVFDIGEVEGRHFISMEFLDGDDLSSLLKRVGRLSPERAVEISRQLCVGMAAIHSAGILHRDFKPANIIIDSKGIARITDFGIAGFEAELTNENSRAGTPAYMSPEQISGRELTTRSDIYALGLVLYEIFTAKQAFSAHSIQELIRKHETEKPTSPSIHVKGIDPLVESVIAQCLEKNPKDRPQSALQVAMALPGGNPLQIALDAGQTPSPEMVVAAPKKGVLRLSVAGLLLATVLIGVISLFGFAKRSAVHLNIPLEKSPEVLRERSRELAKKYGYATGDSFYSFEMDFDIYRYIQMNDASPRRLENLSAGRPAILQFSYRSSPDFLVPSSNISPTADDPPRTVSGMVGIRLDTTGRLINFDGIPNRVDKPTDTRKEFDWAGVLKEAGLDPALLERVEPQWTPRQAFDERRAFAGRYPERPDIAIRVEIATYRGKLVSFEIVEPWTASPDGGGNSQVGYFGPVLLLTLYFGTLFTSVWLAVRNVRSGRSDLKGALRVTVGLFSLRMITWMLGTHHVPGIEEVVQLLIPGLQSAIYWACLAGFMYLAFEPYLRKVAPERVIAWNRLLAGSWRDPLVGRDILIGLGAFAAVSLMQLVLQVFLPQWLSKPPAMSITGAWQLSSTERFLSSVVDNLGFSLVFAFTVSFLILFFGLVLRRKWLGTAVVGLIAVAAAIAIMSDRGTYHLIAQAIAFASLVLVSARFGVLACISFTYVMILWDYPVARDLTAWYANTFVMECLIIIALATYGFVTSTAGQRVWSIKVFGEES